MIAPNLNITHALPQFTLGQEYTLPSGETYKYIKASGALVAYEHVVISTDGNFTAVVSNTGTAGHGSGKVQRVGCPQIAIPDTYSGWVFVGGGSYTGKVALNCVQNVPLHLTNVNGVIDDTSTTTLLVGVFLITTVTAAAASPLIATNRMLIAGI